MFLISKLGMLPVINFGSDALKAEVLPRICDGSSQASYCLSEADAGSDVASMKTRGRPRRRRLGDQRHEVLDHQRRHQRPLHGVRPYLRRPPQGHHLLPGQGGVGRARRQARAQARASRARRPASCDSTIARARRAGVSARSVRASPWRCTRSTARGRRSARRRSASPRVRSTSPSAT